MELTATALLDSRLMALQRKRAALTKQPGIALIWIGEDIQTSKFVRTKQKMAQTLDCQFFLHHFPEISERQLLALIDGLNRKKEVDGIVLQLPLPSDLDTELCLQHLGSEKDIDGLTPTSKFLAPTATGIVSLLEANEINPREYQTVIIGDGKLVGHPLAELFRINDWPFIQINSNAQEKVSQIAAYDLIISCTGVTNIVTPEMVKPETVLVDGTGVDVDVKLLEPLVELITPSKGAIGPLTVSFLFENLLNATG